LTVWDQLLLQSVVIWNAVLWHDGCTFFQVVTWLPNLSTYSLAVIWLWWVMMVPKECYNIAAQTIMDPPMSCFTATTRHSRWCVLQTQTLPDARSSMKKNSCDHIMHFQFSDVQVLWL
jgi:hypothetical protein